jgi:hypothetical protein
MRGALPGTCVQYARMMGISADHITWLSADEAGVVWELTHIASVAHLLSYHLRKKIGLEDEVTYRHHFDALLICIFLILALPDTCPVEPPKVVTQQNWGDLGICLNCNQFGPCCWQLCTFDYTCTKEGHVYTVLSAPRVWWTTWVHSFGWPNW